MKDLYIVGGCGREVLQIIKDIHPTGSRGRGGISRAFWAI